MLLPSAFQKSTSPIDVAPLNMVPPTRPSRNEMLRNFAPLKREPVTSAFQNPVPDKSAPEKSASLKSPSLKRVSASCASRHFEPLACAVWKLRFTARAPVASVYRSLDCQNAPPVMSEPLIVRPEYSPAPETCDRSLHSPGPPGLSPSMPSLSRHFRGPSRYRKRGA